MIYWDRNPITGRLNNQRRIGDADDYSTAVAFSPKNNAVYIITRQYPSRHDKYSVVTLNRAKRWIDFAGNTVPEGTIGARYAKTCTATDCPTNFFRDATNGCTMTCSPPPGATCNACTSAQKSGCTDMVCVTGYDSNGDISDGCESFYQCSNPVTYQRQQILKTGDKCTACSSSGGMFAYIYCTAITCAPGTFDTNDNAEDGCEGCAVVVDGTCTTCTTKETSGCTAVTCDDGYYDGNNDATDGCEVRGCSFTEVANSDHKTTGSMTGTTGQTVPVVCDAGYTDGTNGGTATCDGTAFAFNSVTCGKLACNDDNCDTCSAADTCMTCNTGYTLNNGVCALTCDDANCDTCSAADTCTTCNTGYTLNNGACALTCDDANCDTCSDAATCTTCKTGFGTCIQQRSVFFFGGILFLLFNFFWLTFSHPFFSPFQHNPLTIDACCWLLTVDDSHRNQRRLRGLRDQLRRLFRCRHVHAVRRWGIHSC